MNIGDRVVCINNKSRLNNVVYGLTLDKIYIICYIDKDSSNEVVIYINDDSGGQYGYYASRFLSVSEQRRLKLDKINILKA